MKGGPDCFLGSDFLSGDLLSDVDLGFDYFLNLPSNQASIPQDADKQGATPDMPELHHQEEQEPPSESESSRQEPKNEHEFIELLDDLNALEERNKSLTKENSALRRKLKSTELELAELKDSIKQAEQNAINTPSPPGTPKLNRGRTIIIPKSPFHNNPHVEQKPNPDAVTYHFKRAVKITLNDPNAPGSITISGVPKQTKLK